MLAAECGLEVLCNGKCLLSKALPQPGRPFGIPSSESLQRRRLLVTRWRWSLDLTAVWATVRLVAELVVDSLRAFGYSGEEDRRTFEIAVRRLQSRKRRAIAKVHLGTSVASTRASKRVFVARRRRAGVPDTCMLEHNAPAQINSNHAALRHSGPPPLRCVRSDALPRSLRAPAIATEASKRLFGARGGVHECS